MGSFDKRRHPRFDGGVLEAQLKVDGTARDTIVENVSLGGALLTGRCTPGKNVLLELRAARGRSLRVVGRVVDVVPAGRGRSQPALRIRFHPPSASCTAELYALIRGLPDEGAFAAAPTDPEAYEFHSISLDADEVATELSLDIEVVEPEEEVLELKDVVEDDEPTVIVDPLERELQTRAMRIEELERQLALVRRNARTLEELLVPAALAS